MPNAILAAVDDSQASLKLVDLIIKNFKGYDVILSHVHCKVPYPTAGGAAGAFYVDESQEVLDMEAEKEEVLFVKNTLCPRLEAAGVKFTTELVRIHDNSNKAIGTALCKRAENLKPAFLVLSKHSKNPITAFFVGSVTQHCLRHASCPVVVV